MIFFSYIITIKQIVMVNLHFIQSSKINSRISNTVLNGYHITIDGMVYEQVTSRPYGKTLKRKLQNLQKQERILIYG